MTTQHANTPEVAEHPVELYGWGRSDAAGYAEDFGPLVAEMEEDPNKTAPATMSSALMFAIHKAREFLASNPLAKCVHLDDDGLCFDDEALLGEFRADCEAIRVWSNGHVDWRAEHEHNPEAEVRFDIKFPNQ